MTQRLYVSARRPRLRLCHFFPTDYHAPPQQPLRDTRQCPALDFKGQRTSVENQDSTHRDCRSMALRPHIALHLLQVCRQVYGEAALIPFTKNSFIVEVWYHACALRTLLATLIAAQVRSITKLFIAVGSCSFFASPRSLGTLKLKGLRSLHLVLAERYHVREYPWASPLRSRLDASELGSLSQLDLTSVDFSFMFTSEESKTAASFGTNDIETLVESHRKEIIGRPGAYLARRKAGQEERERARDARRARVRSKRRLRSLTGNF
jgi:hypothetical protein